MRDDDVPRSIPSELEAELTPGVRAFIELLLARISDLEQQVVQWKKTPQNSSLPPSSQHPHAKPPSGRAKSKKKRGAQPGHQKHERPLIPTDDCDEVNVLKPPKCRRCWKKLSGKDPQPLRHQVWEVPPIRPHVTEYQLHRLECPCCGTTTCAELPPGVPSGQAGPRLVALTALLLACFRQSKRGTVKFLHTILGQPGSTGWVVKLQNQATRAVRPAYEELAAKLPDEPVLALDETPTKEGPDKCWLWTYVAAQFTLFAVRPSRQATGVTDLLGETFSGVVHCDRARMYLGLARLQWCWAHLQRDFQALIDSKNNTARRLGHDLMRPTKKLFMLWARIRDGTLTRRGFKRLMRPIRNRIEALLLRGVFSGQQRITGMCHELYDHRDWLWNFVEVEGVEPTNNASERALRHAVIWRKLSFGTQSAAGSRFVETMLTVIETCRQQNRPVFDYLVEAIEAHSAGKPTPSLLSRV